MCRSQPSLTPEEPGRPGRPPRLAQPWCRDEQGRVLCASALPAHVNYPPLLLLLLRPLTPQRLTRQCSQQQQLHQSRRRSSSAQHSVRSVPSLVVAREVVLEPLLPRTGLMVAAACFHRNPGALVGGRGASCRR